MTCSRSRFELHATWLLAIAVVLSLCQTEVSCVRFEEDVTITYNQKEAIDKLRERVGPYITEGYMKEDIFLVKWLRASNYDLRRAEKRIIEMIRWRKANRMDMILQEDFSDVAEDYPYTTNGFDRDGRPILIGFAGEWDIRSAVVTGRAPRVLRYMDQGMEVLARSIRKLQKEGKNVTQAVLIIDLGQFSLVTHGCVQCLLRIVDFLNSYESHFPGMAHKVYFTNAPPTVAVALEIIRQTVSKETNEAIEVYGTNKAQWQRVLTKNIDKKFLPVELGGSWERD